MNDLVSKKYSDIGQKILQYFIDRRLVILEGEIGSGKAKVAELVSNFWGKEKDHICVFLKKRQNSPDSSYIPFYVGLAQFLQKNTSLTDVIDPVLTVSSSIPKYGGWGGSFQKLLHYTNELHKTKTPQLNDYEHEILYRYNKNFKNKKLLLIAVDIEEWDNGSIQLLNTILSEELESIYTFTKEVSILVTSSKLSGSAIEKSLLEYLPVKIAVPPLDTNQIVSIFKESGISKEEISYENIIAIQKITGGNAYLIKSLIDYVINNTKLIDVNLFNESNATTEFVSTLLRLRFEQLGATGEQIANILEYASVIGLTFEYKELECISKSEVFELRKIIQKANDLSFIQQPESSPSFSHEIIRMFFLERVNKEKPNHYNTFSECLRLLRPSDYLTRANLYFEAGNFNQATILYIMAIIQWYREGFPIPVVIEHRAMQFAKEYLLNDYLNKIREAYELFLQNKFEATLQILKRIDLEIYPDILGAEICYLQALCYSKNPLPINMNLAKDILSQWSELKLTELELWVRLMSTLLIIHTHVGELVQAKDIERIIKRALSGRIAYDKGTQYQYNILQRKSASLFETEIAVEKTEACVIYFKGDSVPMGREGTMQLYMALTNHSANHLILADYEKAFEVSTEALSLIEEYPFIKLPRRYIPMNNFLVSGILNNKIPNSEAISAFENLISSNDKFSDKFLLKNNLACLYGKMGNIQKGKEVLEVCIQEMQNLEVSDEYYWYYIKSNSLAFSHLSGDDLNSNKLLNELRIIKVPILDWPFYKRRLDLLGECLSNINPSDYLAWDSYLINTYKYEIGPAWQFYGRGFLFSDIQFWSES